MADILFATHGKANKASPLYQAAKLVIATCGGVTPNRISAGHIVQLIRELSRKDRSLHTRKTRTNQVKRILRELWEDHGAPKLDGRIPSVRGCRPRNVRASAKEREAIIGSAPAHLRLWILLCSDLALRSGTAYRLNRDDYNAEDGELAILTKMGERLLMPVTQEIRSLLAECDRHSPVSFVRQLWVRWANARGGRGIKPDPLGHQHDSLQKQYRAHVENLGLRRITLHDLRRTTAVALYQHTHDLREVQSLLGHASLQNTVWYLDHDLSPISRATLEVIKGGKSQPQPERKQA